LTVPLALEHAGDRPHVLVGGRLGGAGLDRKIRRVKYVTDALIVVHGRLAWSSGLKTVCIT
jgi:hypothetical protein